MTIYMIRDTKTNLWYRNPGIGGRRWTSQVHASIFRSHLDAEANVENDDCVIVAFILAPAAPRRVALVRSPYHDAFYIDGKRAVEKQTILSFDMLDAIGVQHEWLDANENWIDARMAGDPEFVYPVNLEDVVLK